jgi:competence protein ComEC
MITRRIIFTTIALLISLPTFAESVRVQIIDVGQADGIVIRTPGKDHWVVIDAGTGKQFSEYLVDMGVSKLDIAIVTHRHYDHQGGMDDVIKAIPPDLFFGVTEDCPGRTSDDKVRDAITEKLVSVHPLTHRPDEHTVDSVTFTIFPLPPRSECPDHENLNSIVVRMDYGDFSMLFAGDAENDELAWLLDNHPDLLDVDVLKASYHGSNNGITAEFLSTVSPERVVISAGVNGTYKHPMANAVTAYLEATNHRVYCTNRHGTIRVYGYSNGNSRVYKQHKIDKSCVYDGTHY